MVGYSQGVCDNSITVTTMPCQLLFINVYINEATDAELTAAYGDHVRATSVEGTTAGEKALKNK